MRHLATVLIAATLLLGLWWLLNGVDEPGFNHFIPADAFGVLIINRFPDSLDFVSQTRLGEWVEIDLGTRPELRDLYESGLVDNIRESGESVWLCVHGIRPSEGGSYRIDFTAFMTLHQGRGEYLEQIIEEAVIDHFGREETLVLDEDGVRILRGDEKGHIFYLSRTASFLTISNTREGWTQVTLARNRTIPSLAESPGYQQIVERLDSSADLFLYFGGARSFSFLPEFGYTIDIDGTEVRDSYFEVPCQSPPTQQE
jgi:hypothetical protein